MEGENDGTLSSLTFPLPPMQYVELYSDHMLATGQSPAPPPPVEGHYTMFGELHNTQDDMLPSLDSQGIKRLYALNADPRQELKRLNRSLVAGFLDLLEILIRCPDSAERAKKLDDLRLLFINMHHLINDYRPHQARETLRLLLEVQKSERLAIVDRFNHHFEAVHSSLRLCLEELPSDLALSEELLKRIETVLGRKEAKIEDGNIQTKSGVEKDKLMMELLESEVN